MPSRSSSPRSMPTPWAYSLIASRRAARGTPTPSCCSIKPDGTARRRSRCRWEEPIHSIKSVNVPLPDELPRTHGGSRRIALLVHNSRGLQRQRDVCSDYVGFSRARLSIVSPSEPVVVDADCLKLELHRPHDQHHVLDQRHCFHRHPLVHGLLRIPVPSQGGNTGDIQSG